MKVRLVQPNHREAAGEYARRKDQGTSRLEGQERATGIPCNGIFYGGLNEEIVELANATHTHIRSVDGKGENEDGNK